MKKKYLVLSLLVFMLMGCGQSMAHKFYVSLCNIDHNPETSSLEISMRVFTDDLEYAITGSEKPYGLGSAKEPAEADSLIFSYILDNFSLHADRRSCTLVYIGKEVELDVCWCYIEIEAIEGFSELEIRNNMLTELFPEQVNVINVNYRDQTLGLLLKKGKPEGLLKF